MKSEATEDFCFCTSYLEKVDGRLGGMKSTNNPFNKHFHAFFLQGLFFILASAVRANGLIAVTKPSYVLLQWKTLKTLKNVAGYSIIYKYE